MISDETRKEVLERDSIDDCPCCIYCGRPLLVGANLHHVKFRSQLGKDDKNNLVTLCFNCHRKLHDGDKDIQIFCKDYLERVNK